MGGRRAGVSVVVVVVEEDLEGTKGAVTRAKRARRRILRRMFLLRGHRVALWRPYPHFADYW
jgi:hypothetical protein